MSKKDYYDILGVSRSATEQDIKSAYRRLAVKYHPDKNPGDTSAEEKFKEAAEAYSILSNPEQRKRYDTFGHAGVSSAGAGAGNWGAGGGFTDLEDILGDFFGFGDMFGRRGGTRRNNAQRGADLRYDLEISLEDAAMGLKTQLKIPRLETCDECGGKGAEKGSSPETCITCNGAGQVRYQQGFFSVARTCGTCRGTGQIIKAPCKKCNGAGRVEREKILEIQIPAGVETGSRIRLNNQGEAGTNGGPTGDLYVVIHVSEHEEFERQGSHLYSAVPITFTQAALGAKVVVKTLDGTHELNVPSGTQNGTVFRVKGHGMPILGGKGKGDLFVSVTVIVPTSLSREQRKLLEQLAEMESQDIEDQGLLDKVRNIFG